MRSEWRYTLLENLADSRQGAIAIGPFGSRLKTDAYTESGVALIRGQNLTDSKTLSGEFVFVSDETAGTLGNANVKPFDLVFPHRGNIGSVGIVPEDTQRYALSTSLMKITLDREKVAPLFLYYFFRSAQGRAELLKNASQVGTPGIATPLTSLRACVVPVPSLEEQVKIAQFLSLLDGRIDLLRQTNVTLESIAQALFKSWFIDFDPVRAHAEGREPEGMDVETARLFPETIDTWLQSCRRITVSDAMSSGILLIGDGYRAKNSELGYPGIGFVRAGDLLNGCITPTEDLLSMAALDKARSKMAKTGDTAFTSKGTIGRFAYVDRDAGDAVYSPQVCFWRSLNNTELHPAFLHFWMKSRLFSNQVDMVRGQAAIMDFVSLSDQRRMLLDMPPPAVQRRFSEIVQPILKQISGNRTAARILIDIRDTLLPRLVSGRLRLLETEAQLNEALA